MSASGLPPPPGGVQPPTGLPTAPPVIPMDVGQILERSFGLFRRHWIDVVPLVAIVMFPATLLQFWMLRQGGRHLYRYIDPITHRSEVACRGACAPAVAWFVLAFTVIVLSTVPLSLALARIAARAFSGAGHPRDGLAEALSLVVPAIVASALVWLAILGGLIAVIIPGLILLVRFSITRQVIAIERAGPITAIRRSWAMTRGNGWHTLGIIVVVALLAGIAGQAAQIVGFAPLGVRVIAIGAIAVVVRPFVSFAHFLLYVDLRARHDGLTTGVLAADLERRS